MGGRATAQGYSAVDNVRQRFTGSERDGETGLDYMQARYYAGAQGRFTSVDPGNFQAMRDLRDPQSWNAYAYVNNNPLGRTDPDGRGFWSKLGNLLSWGVWGEEADVKAVENQKRAQLLKRSQELGRTDGIYIYRVGCPDCPATVIDVRTASRSQIWDAARATPGGEPISPDDVAKLLQTMPLGQGTVQPTPTPPTEANNPSQSPLKRLHQNLDEGTLQAMRKKSTEQLLEELKPGNPESLKVKPDGTIMNGHHRVRVLQERGVDVNSLPREIYTGTP
jgi:RHS repeat-associated protein